MIDRPISSLKTWRRLVGVLFVLLVGVLCWISPAAADTRGQTCEPGRAGADEVHIYVLTMTPGGEVWSIFGHVAFWVSDGRTGEDHIYNFGDIDDRDVSVDAFLRGELRFLSTTRAFRHMLRFYGRMSRVVIAQRLALDQPRAQALAQRLAQIVTSPEAAYRYHWLDNNCATRIRDLLDEALDGKLKPQHQGMTGVTPRDEVLRHLGPEWPLWFGWNFAVGHSADVELTHWDALFIPDRFPARLDESVITIAGRAQPLVKYRCEILRGTHDWAPKAPPQRGLTLWALGALLGGLFLGLGFLAGRRQRRWAGRVLGMLTVLFGALVGVLGSASVYLWLKSTYPGFHLNENLFYANPLSFALVPLGLSLVFGWPRGLHRATRVLWALLAVGAIGALLSALSVLGQDNVGFEGFFLLPLVGLALALRMKAGPTS